MYKIINMIKLLTTLAFVISIALTENNKITGYVIDNNTGEKLAGVMVMTETDTTYSDLDGHFTLPNINDSTKIWFEYISYEIKDTIIYNNNQLIVNEIITKE